MIDALINGKVYGTPEQRTTKTGNPFTRVKIRVPTQDGGAVFCTGFCFSESLQAQLMALDDGDPVAVAGSLNLKPWLNNSGEPHVNLDITVQGILSPYHVTRKRSAMQESKPEGKPAAPARQQHSGPPPAFADIPDDPL